MLVGSPILQLLSLGGWRVKQIYRPARYIKRYFYTVPTELNGATLAGSADVRHETYDCAANKTAGHILRLTKQLGSDTNFHFQGHKIESGTLKKFVRGYRVNGDGWDKHCRCQHRK